MSISTTFLDGKMKPKRVCFFGLFGQQNLGNEGTLKAILFNARKHIPNLEMHCICTDPADTANRYKIKTFPISDRYAKGFRSEETRGNHGWLRRLTRKLFVRLPRELLHLVKAFRFLIGTDMLVIPGTGILSDYSTRFFGWPYFIFKWATIAKICRCKLLFISVGAGPISHPLSKWFIKRALSMADYRSYRDDYSKRYLMGIGFDAKDDPVYPDIAFSLPVSILAGSDLRGEKKYMIGVGVMDYSGKFGEKDGAGEATYREYLGKMKEFLMWLLEHQYTVRLLIGDVLYDNRVKHDLVTLLEKSGFPVPGQQVIDKPISTMEELVSQLHAVAVIVSPRFHNIIFSLMLNKPVVSLSYHEKFASIMAGVGLADYCQNIDQLDVNILIRQVTELERKSASIKPYIRQKTEEYRKSLDEQYNLVFGMLGTR